MRYLIRSLLLIPLIGCVGHVHVETSARPPAEAIGRLAVAPTVLLRDVPGALESSPFRDNVFVGNLVFNGGYVTEQAEWGLQNVSAEIDEEAIDAYTAQVRDVTDALLADALRKEAWTRIDPVAPELLVAPRRIRERGSYPDAGHDNVNLPRFALEPKPLGPEALAAIPDGHDALLVPFVVRYYSHNAGWFVGQTWGTAAGARYRVLLATYDAQTGAPLGWSDTDVRFLHDRVFQPNSSQVEDFLMAAERRLAREIRKNLPR